MTTLSSEIQLLNHWVANERESRFKMVMTTLGDFEPESISKIKEDPVLQKHFNEYINWAQKMKFQSTFFQNNVKDAIEIINSRLNKDLFPNKSSPNYESFDLNNIQHRLALKPIMKGFQIWLATNISNEEYSKSELRELFGSPNEGAETGLCRLNPENKSGLMSLREEIAGYRTPFATQLHTRLESVNRENYSKTLNLDWLFSNRLIKPLIYQDRHPIFSIHPQHNFNGVEVSPIMNKARDQLERLIQQEKIKLEEFGKVKSDSKDMLHQHFEDFKLHELEQLIRDKLNEEPLLFEALMEFLPRLVDHDNVQNSDLLMLTTVFS